MNMEDRALASDGLFSVLFLAWNFDCIQQYSILCVGWQAPKHGVLLLQVEEKQIKYDHQPSWLKPTVLLFLFAAFGELAEGKVACSPWVHFKCSVQISLIIVIKKLILSLRNRETEDIKMLCLYMLYRSEVFVPLQIWCWCRTDSPVSYTFNFRARKSGTGKFSRLTT